MLICNTLIVLLQIVALFDAVHSSSNSEITKVNVDSKTPQVTYTEADPNEKNLEEYLGDSVKRFELKTPEEKSFNGVKPGVKKTSGKKYFITPIPKEKKPKIEDDMAYDPYLVKCLRQESPITEDIDNPETVKAVFICEDVRENKTQMSQEDMEEKKIRLGVMPPEELAPPELNTNMTKDGTIKTFITRIEPNKKKTFDTADISLTPIEEEKPLRERDNLDDSDDRGTRLEMKPLKNDTNRSSEDKQGIEHPDTDKAVVESIRDKSIFGDISLVEPEKKRTLNKREILKFFNESMKELQHKSPEEQDNRLARVLDIPISSTTKTASKVEIQTANQLPTDSPKFKIQVEERTQMAATQTGKPTLFERMQHNRHRQFHSEENKEDKPLGPVPCTCGVFLSGQFKKGSKQQPKGLPVLTQEMDNPFMNNAMGSRQCTNKCLELIIKHLPKSSDIICATVERENVFKERAYLFIKNHSDKWHGTNLSAGREFCCRNNTSYKCPAN